MGWAILKRFAFQRITPNVNNPHYIRGGRLASAVCPTVLSQPATTLDAAIGVPFSYSFAQHFGGGGPGRAYSLAGVLPSWASFSTTTGVYSGTPDVGTVTAAIVTATQPGCVNITLSGTQIRVQT